MLGDTAPSPERRRGIKASGSCQITIIGGMHPNDQRTFESPAGTEGGARGGVEHPERVMHEVGVAAPDPWGSPDPT